MTALLVALGLTAAAIATLRARAHIHDRHCPCTWANDTAEQ